MTADLLNMFAVSLGLTIILELFIALLWGLRSKTEFLIVILVNILTNPAAVLIVWLVSIYAPNCSRFFIQIPVELIVIAVESVIYLCFSTKSICRIKHPVLFALTANTASWGTGVILLLFRP
jgi:hypothetical protein